MASTGATHRGSDSQGGDQAPRGSEEADDFFRAIGASGGLPVGVEAAEGTAAVLCTLLGRLELEQARRVLDALPPAVVQKTGTCPIHGGEQGEALNRTQFLAEIGHHFELAGPSVVPMVRAVLHTIRARLPPAVVNDIDSQLPSELLALWRPGDRG
jgi:uncharacterized protein (DUF2267 family)